MKVKAAVVRAHGVPLVIEGLDLDEPRAGEIVVRLVASGITQADGAALAGRLPMPLPFVPGNAGAGIVERVGETVIGLQTGDAVLLSAVARELGALDLAGRRSDGSAPFSGEDGLVNGFFFGQSSFATHLLCSASSAIKLPVGAPLEVLAGLPGEMLLGAAAVANVLALKTGDTIVITGADAAGLAATMMARARGASMIIVADPREARRDLATALGATVAVHTDGDLAAVVKSLTGDGVRFALETIGHAAARQACLDSLASGGTSVIIDPSSGRILPRDDHSADNAGLVMSPLEQIDMDALVAELVTLHGSGQLPIEKLVDFFPFELVNDALEALNTARVVKPVIRFSLGSFGDLDRALTEGAAREAPNDLPTDGSVPDSVPAQDEPGEERQPSVPA